MTSLGEASPLVSSSDSLLLKGVKTHVKSKDSTKDRTGVCRSANRLLLFAAQLHPTGASKAQSEAAGKLEERSEGEGPHQLSQQRKNVSVLLQAGWSQSARGRGEFWGHKPTKARFFLGPARS